MGLAACGGPDPTPPADGAASASAINASVAEAQNLAVNAQMEASGAPNTPEARQDAARNVLGEGDTPAGGGGAAAAQRPTTVDPSAGDPLPPQR